MKVTCWNSQITIMAENEQDSAWLFYEFVRRFENRKDENMRKHIHLILGESLGAREFEVLAEDVDLNEKVEDRDQNYYFVRQGKNADGNDFGTDTAEVIGVKISAYEKY